jgi:hypothetical protein
MYPKGSIKDVQVTEEAFSTQREHPALQLKHKISFFFFFFSWVIFALLDPEPDSDLGSHPDPNHWFLHCLAVPWIHKCYLRIRIHGSIVQNLWVRIQELSTDPPDPHPQQSCFGSALHSIGILVLICLLFSHLQIFLFIYTSSCR